jgi:hypothetical protein
MPASIVLDPCRNATNNHSGGRGHRIDAKCHQEVQRADRAGSFVSGSSFVRRHSAQYLSEAINKLGAANRIEAARLARAERLATASLTPQFRMQITELLRLRRWLLQWKLFQTLFVTRQLCLAGGKFVEAENE